MELILKVYALFALTTAIASYKFYYRALNEAKLLDVDNYFTQSPYKGGFVFFIVSILAAPLLFIPVIFEDMGNSFYDKFKESIIQE